MIAFVLRVKDTAIVKKLDKIAKERQISRNALIVEIIVSYLKGVL